MVNARLGIVYFWAKIEPVRYEPGKMMLQNLGQFAKDVVDGKFNEICD